MRPEGDALLWFAPRATPLSHSMPSPRKAGARLQCMGVGPVSPEEERQVRITDLRSFREL